MVHIFLNYPTPSNQQLVLSHGDCWLNNLLFRYNDAGDPVEVMLVDLQSIRKHTPAVDLNYFLFTSFSSPERRLNLEEFLETYYTTFSSLLVAGEAPVPFTLEDLRLEFRRHMIYGCVTRIILTPYVLGEEEDAPEVEDVTENDLEEVAKARMRTIVSMGQREGSFFKTKLLDVFDDMIEAGLLS
ncbi:uncharacterized kinase-like protein D1044.1 [Panulirus ornatus]|uniref:uncharacterized kinase-like protein D1044.1 n=1 Tax=Panulirus ornatus TaxID=150431 RepID=UPI003A8B6056